MPRAAQDCANSPPNIPPINYPPSYPPVTPPTTGGRDGKDGLPGRDGQDGLPGKDAVIDYARLEAMIDAAVAKIPAGAKGDKGDTGERGPIGPAYVLTQTDIDNIVAIAITRMGPVQLDLIYPDGKIVKQNTQTPDGNPNGKPLKLILSNVPVDPPDGN